MEYDNIKLETQKLRIVKEHILLRLVGLGWEDAYHPWSRHDRTYTADELFNHLFDIIIPLAE
jgi:hypothetical protein